MGFLTLHTPTKTVTEHVDELPWWAISTHERKEMMKQEGFFAFHPKGGYYKSVQVKILKEEIDHGV